MLNEKAIEARRAYKRKWAKEHPEKVKAAQERYWQKKRNRRNRKPQPANKRRRSVIHGI